VLLRTIAYNIMLTLKRFHIRLLGNSQPNCFSDRAIRVNRLSSEEKKECYLIFLTKIVTTKCYRKTLSIGCFAPDYKGGPTRSRLF